jgi:hypothetical protein
LFYTLPGTVLSATGEFPGRGLSITRKRLVRLIENSQMHASTGRHVAPVVIGHTTGGPAVGVVAAESMRLEPDPEEPGEWLLVGDILNVPEHVVEMLDVGHLLTGSAEIRFTWVDELGVDRGPVLWRFALLGDTAPAVTRVGILPVPELQPAPVPLRSLTWRLATYG